MPHWIGESYYTREDIEREVVEVRKMRFVPGRQSLLRKAIDRVRSVFTLPSKATAGKDLRDA